MRAHKKRVRNGKKRNWICPDVLCAPQSISSQQIRRYDCASMPLLVARKDVRTDDFAFVISFRKRFLRAFTHISFWMFLAQFHFHLHRLQFLNLRVEAFLMGHDTLCQWFLGGSSFREQQVVSRLLSVVTPYVILSFRVGRLRSLSYTDAQKIAFRCLHANLWLSEVRHWLWHEIKGMKDKRSTRAMLQRSMLQPENVLFMRALSMIASLHARSHLGKQD